MSTFRATLIVYFQIIMKKAYIFVKFLPYTAKKWASNSGRQSGSRPSDAAVHIRVVFSVFMVSLITLLPSSGSALEGKSP